MYVNSNRNKSSFAPKRLHFLNGNLECYTSQCRKCALFFFKVSKKDFLRKMFLTRKEKCVLTNYLLVVSLTLYPVLVASFGLLTGTDAVTKRKQKSVNYRMKLLNKVWMEKNVEKRNLFRLSDFSVRKVFLFCFVFSYLVTSYG